MLGARERSRRSATCRRSPRHPAPRARHLLLLLLAACLPLRRPPPAPRLNLGGYQEGDGAITLYRGGNIVDPYFATKALLAARAAGADVERAGRAWAAWGASRQLPDGRIERHCRAHAGSPWVRCWDADADDALSALWLELLYAIAPAAASSAPSSGSANPALPPPWRASADAAERHLAELRGPSAPDGSLYRVSRSQPAALLMDNAEIYGALTAVAHARRRRGDRAGAERAAAQADTLARAIARVFWRPERAEYAISTQQSAADTVRAFYPDAVAQLYPWLAALPAPPGAPTARPAFDRWMRRYGDRWLSFADDPYPWGLVALAAHTVGDDATARRWIERAAPLRGTGRWNVLEEAVFQALRD